MKSNGRILKCLHSTIHYESKIDGDLRDPEYMETLVEKIMTLKELNDKAYYSGVGSTAMLDDYGMDVFNHFLVGLMEGLDAKKLCITQIKDKDNVTHTIIDYSYNRNY